MRIHEHFHQFKSVFSDILNKHAPTRLQTRKESKWQKKKRGHVSIRKKNELFAYQLQNPRDEMAVDLYKTYRNKLTHIKEISKKMYYESVTNNWFVGQNFSIAKYNDFISKLSSDTHGEKIVRNQETKMQVLCIKREKERKKEKRTGKKGGGKALIGQSDQLFRRVNQR